METIDWFKFEDNDRDFPFYKKNPTFQNGAGLYCSLHWLWD